MELFCLLKKESMSFAAARKELISKLQIGVRCNHLSRDTSGLAICNHKEANSRMMVHLVDSVHRGYSKIKIHTDDTAVAIVMFVAVISEVKKDTEVWIFFGTCNDCRYMYIPINSIFIYLWPLKSLSL